MLAMVVWVGVEVVFLDTLAPPWARVAVVD
jgi:hypothetical protein